MDMRYAKLKRLLVSGLFKRGSKISETPKGFYKDMMKETGESYTVLSNMLHQLRKGLDCRPQANKPKKRRKKTTLYEEAKENGAIRTMPGENIRVTKECHKELSKIFLRTPDALSQVLPKNRICIIIGTGTCFAVSPNHSKYCDRVFHDEL